LHWLALFLLQLLLLRLLRLLLQLQGSLRNVRANGMAQCKFMTRQCRAEKDLSTATELQRQPVNAPAKTTKAANKIESRKPRPKKTGSSMF